MRRWVLIVLLVVYPFQVALAMADNCCAMTPAGVTHHSADIRPGATAAEPVFVADDGAASLADPHCAACTFGHSFYLPSHCATLHARPDTVPGSAFTTASPPLPPVTRLERPKWPAAAR